MFFKVCCAQAQLLGALLGVLSSCLRSRVIPGGFVGHCLRCWAFWDVSYDAEHASAGAFHVAEHTSEQMYKTHKNIENRNSGKSTKTLIYKCKITLVVLDLFEHFESIEIPKTGCLLFLFQTKG